MTVSERYFIVKNINGIVIDTVDLKMLMGATIIQENMEVTSTDDLSEVFNSDRTCSKSISVENGKNPVINIEETGSNEPRGNVIFTIGSTNSDFSPRSDVGSVKKNANLLHQPNLKTPVVRRRLSSRTEEARRKGIVLESDLSDKIEANRDSGAFSTKRLVHVLCLTICNVRKQLIEQFYHMDDQLQAIVSLD